MNNLAIQYREISPSTVCDYLKAKGWFLEKQHPDFGSIWVAEETKVLVPHRQNLPPYVMRLKEAIKTIAEREVKTEESIFRALQMMEETNGNNSQDS